MSGRWRNRTLGPRLRATEGHPLLKQGPITRRPHPAARARGVDGRAPASTPAPVCMRRESRQPSGGRHPRAGSVLTAECRPVLGRKAALTPTAM